MDEDPNEIEHSVSSSADEDENDQSEKDESDQEEDDEDESEVNEDSSSDEGESDDGSDADSLGPLNSERGSGESFERKSSAGPKLGDFLDANRRKAQQLPADSGERSLQQELEARKVSPQLTDLVVQSMRDLNSALQSLEMINDGDGLAASNHTSTTARESWSSDMTGTTTLRNQINAVDEGRLSANSIPPELRAMLAQQGLEKTPTGTRKSLAVPPTEMMGAALEEGDESSSGSSGNMPSGTLPLQAERTVEAVEEDEADNGDDKAPFVESSSPPNTPTETSKPPMAVDTNPATPIDDSPSHDEYSSPQTTPMNTSKPTEPPSPPFESNLRRDKDEISETNYTFLTRFLVVFILCALIYVLTPAITGKSLPASASKPRDVADGASIRTSHYKPRAPTVRTHLSDDALYDAFEALVGTDIYVSGSSQYLAAWWILEEDTRRHRATLERLEQRFLLAYFYFKTTNNGETPWLSCNYKLASSLPTTAGSRQGFNTGRSKHEISSRTAVAERDATSRPRSTDASCEFETPRYGEQGDITGYETTSSFRWLSGHSECSWAGVTCKHEDDSLEFDPVVEINLEGQMDYEATVTELMQLPHLEFLYYR